MNKGFTLIEILVAMAIFAMLSVMAVSGMSTLLENRQAQLHKMQQMKEWQWAHLRLSNDLAQVINRPIRDYRGELQSGFEGNPVPAMLGQTTTQQPARLFAFTHTGYINPNSAAIRSQLQRVSYVLEKGQLIRESVRVLDPLADSVVDRRVILSNLTALTLDYVDTLGAYQQKWQSNQSFETTEEDKNNLPAAVILKFSTQGLGESRWQFLIPAGQQYAGQ